MGYRAGLQVVAALRGKSRARTWCARGVASGTFPSVGSGGRSATLSFGMTSTRLRAHCSLACLPSRPTGLAW
eukprot:2743616-Alexandrium_andersonii.AAC.1